MKVIAFATQKGGSGKSTLATSLAVAAIQAQEKVFLIEMDRQGTLTNWFDDREDEEPGLGLSAPKDLGQDLNELKESGVTVTIIDTPGQDSPGVRPAILAADLVIVPVQPSPPDIEGCQATVRTLRQIGKPFLFVLNRVDPRPNSVRTVEAVEALEASGDVAAIRAGDRKDYQDAFGLGLGAGEFAPGGKAAQEMRKLWDEVDQRAGKAKKNATAA